MSRRACNASAAVIWRPELTASVVARRPWRSSNVAASIAAAASPLVVCATSAPAILLTPRATRGAGSRHEQISDRARVADRAEKDAEDRPLRMVAASRKAVMPAEPPAARDGRRGGAGGERGRSDRVRIVAPHIDLRLFGIGGDDPLVLA